jgi:hypothetical protein
LTLEYTGGSHTTTTKGAEMARSGIVELLSGRWEWSLVDARQGSTVVFRHSGRWGDEMRNWVPTRDLTGDEAREAAEDAVLRFWTAPGGTRWSLTLEPIWACDLSQDVGLPADAREDTWLVFASSWKKVRVPVPGATQLGGLSGDVLSRLLRTENARSWLQEHRALELESEPAFRSGHQWG